MNVCLGAEPWTSSGRFMQFSILNQAHRVFVGVLSEHSSMIEAPVDERTLTQLILPVVLVWILRLLLPLCKRKRCEIVFVDGVEECNSKRMVLEYDRTSSGQLLPSVQRPHPCMICITTKCKTDAV